MAKKALITGATGFLGRAVVTQFERDGWKVVGTGFSRAKPPSIHKVDLTDASAVAALFEQEQPQVVVHCAANRFPDKVDADPDGARAINVDATRTLVQAASRVGSLVIYISTDYVFPGREGEAPYEADANPEPPNLYGQTKLDGERVTLGETTATGLGVVLRVPVLYGHAEKPSESAINTLQDAVEKAQTADVSMDHWAQRYPTNTADVGRVCSDIASKYLDANSDRTTRPKILQFSSEDRMTKYEICQMFAEMAGQRLDRMEAVGVDPAATVQRPYDTHLSTKALKELNIPVSTQDFRAWWRLQARAFRH